MEIFKGRPENTAERLEKEVRCYDFLDKIGVEYDRVDHEAADDMEACIAIEKVIGVGICKNLFLCNRQKTNFYLLMMSGEKNFRTADISKQIGTARLSFATAEDMLKYLDITPGSVSVLGLMNDKDNDVTLLVDKDIVKQDFVRCHPCINTSTLRIKTEDFIKKILPKLGYYPTYVEVN